VWFAQMHKGVVQLETAFTIFSLNLAKVVSIAFNKIRNKLIDLVNFARGKINFLASGLGFNNVNLKPLEKVTTVVKDYDNAIKAATESGKKRIEGIEDGIVFILQESLATGKSKEELEAYNKQLKAEAIRKRELLKIQEEEKKAAAQAIKDAKKLAEANKKAADEAIRMAKAKADARAARGESIRSDVRTPQEIFDEVKAELVSLEKTGDITQETFSRALASATEDLEKFKSAGQQEFGEFTEFAKEAARGIQNTFADFFFDIMQGNFDNMGDNFKRTIDRMVADFLASKLAGALFGDFGTSSGSLGGLVGQGVAGAKNLFQGFFADGGSVTANRPAIVGERGPELFVPSMSGSVVSNEALSGGSNSIAITIQALDTKDVLSKLEEIKRPLTEMINGTNNVYGLQNGVAI